MSEADSSNTVIMCLSTFLLGVVVGYSVSTIGRKPNDDYLKKYIIIENEKLGDLADQVKNILDTN
jgi:hypothetical protein